MSESIYTMAVGSGKEVSREILLADGALISLAALSSATVEEKRKIVSFLTKELDQIAREELPVSIFSNDSLSALEAIVKYMKENLRLSFAEISRLLNRNSRTIWTTYQVARKRMPARFAVTGSAFTIPTSIFQNRTYSVLEAIVSYLHKNTELQFAQIARLLNRSYRTILTVHRRAGIKDEQLR
ncbi:MAG: hypothetical protein ABH879_08685 [archaeon]